MNDEYDEYYETAVRDLVAANVELPSELKECSTADLPERDVERLASLSLSEDNEESDDEGETAQSDADVAVDVVNTIFLPIM